jgi:hypothetical protein
MSDGINQQAGVKASPEERVAEVSHKFPGLARSKRRQREFPATMAPGA